MCMVRTIRVVIELAEGGPTARVVVAVVVFVHPTPPRRVGFSTGYAPRTLSTAQRSNDKEKMNKVRHSLCRNYRGAWRIIIVVMMCRQVC